MMTRSSVILVNLLIAMMADSFERTRARTQAQFALARAQGILQLLSLPAFGLSRNRPPHHAWVGNTWTMLLQELHGGSREGGRQQGVLLQDYARNPGVATSFKHRRPSLSDCSVTGSQRRDTSGLALPHDHLVRAALPGARQGHDLPHELHLPPAQ